LNYYRPPVYQPIIIRSHSPSEPLSPGASIAMASICGLMFLAIIVMIWVEWRR
jgi:hypothetical protein